jgi:hypothetical protein
MLIAKKLKVKNGGKLSKVLLIITLQKMRIANSIMKTKIVLHLGEDIGSSS